LLQHKYSPTDKRSGNVIDRVVDDTKTKTLMPHILENVLAGSHVMTDE